MSKVYSNITELVGKTPLLELTNYEKNNNLDAKIIAKVEYFNPAGSVKDRIAKAIIEDYDLKDYLKKVLLSLNQLVETLVLVWLLLLLLKVID